MQDLFNRFSEQLFSKLKADETASLFLSAEESFFLRINEGKIRQITQVNQGDLTLILIKNQKNSSITFPFGIDQKQNNQQGLEALQHCRQVCEQLPIDPFCISLNSIGESIEKYDGDFPREEQWFEVLLPLLRDLDCAGLLTSGKVIRASMNSLGQNHWYEGESFSLDCSLYTPEQQSIKFFYGDKDWSSTTFETRFQQAKNQLANMRIPKKVILPGKYRTYLAPRAVATLLGLLSWGGCQCQSLSSRSLPIKVACRRASSLLLGIFSSRRFFLRF